jgi:hypothetical protein
MFSHIDERGGTTASSDRPSFPVIIFGYVKGIPVSNVPQSCLVHESYCLPWFLQNTSYWALRPSILAVIVSAHCQLYGDQNTRSDYRKVVAAMRPMHCRWSSWSLCRRKRQL